MAYRTACDYSDKIAAIVSIAGSTFLDPTLCKAKSPVSILEVHSTMDPIIKYNGGMLAKVNYPSV